MHFLLGFTNSIERRWHSITFVVVIVVDVVVGGGVDGGGVDIT